MNYALFIARRYLQTKKRSALVSRITSIAVGGVFVGTMTLVIVLSVINGFETELRQRIVVGDGHARNLPSATHRQSHRHSRADASFSASRRNHTMIERSC